MRTMARASARWQRAAVETIDPDEPSGVLGICWMLIGRRASERWQGASPVATGSLLPNFAPAKHRHGRHASDKRSQRDGRGKDRGRDDQRGRDQLRVTARSTTVGSL